MLSERMATKQEQPLFIRQPFDLVALNLRANFSYYVFSGGIIISAVCQFY